MSLPFKAVASESAPHAVLDEADRLAMLYNWPRATPLYVQAEKEFQRANDPKDVLEARLGWLRGEAYEEPTPALAAEVERDVRNPSIQADSELRLRCLLAKAAMEEEVNEDYSRATWERIQGLAKGLGDRRWQSRAQAELGIIAFLDGDVATATQTMKNALTSLYFQGDMGAAIYYGSVVGNGQVEAGQPEAGITYCNIALQTAATIKDLGFPFMAYEGKARGLIALHRTAEAKQVLDEAIRQAQAQNAFGAEAQLLVVRGKHEAMVDPQQSIKDFREARQFCQQHDFRHPLAWATFELATAYRQQGDLGQAGRYAGIAERETEALDDKYHLPEDLALMADLAASAGRAKAADALYRRAEDVTEGLLGASPSREVESLLIATLSNIYIGHFRLAAGRLNNVSEAFQILESARGRAIADQLCSGEPHRPPEDPVTLAARKELNRVQIELLHSTVPTERTALLERLFETEQLVSPMGDSQTSFQKAASRGAPITLSAIQSSLSPNEAILEYVLDDPQSLCLYVTHDRAGVTRLPTSRDALVRLVTAYRKEITTRLASPPSSAELYSVLLKPLPAAILKPSLVIVPDGQLNLIPFDALVDNTAEYVLSSHVLSYAPSATVLHLIRRAKKPNPAPIAFLGLGGVPYQGPTETLATNAEAGHGTSAPMSNPFDPNAHTLPDLPSTVDEVKEAGDTLGKSSVLLLGADATEAAFKAEPLDQFGIIHIAAHAIATPRFPERAALVLGEDSAKQEDGLLQAREIQDLRLNADLVTLSACDTGTGRLQGEEGIASLERAFLYAGARSVLASLWTASDVSATTLMIQFYRNLAAGQEEGEALRQSKLELLTEFQGQAAAFYWAGFTLAGDASLRVSSSGQ